MAIINAEALRERANNLRTFNGLELVLVSLQPALAPTEAILEVYFYNSNELANILADPTPANQIFTIVGGHRLLGGPATGQVQVTAIADSDPTDHILELTVAPIGDYSTYTLQINYANMDPILDQVEFKFRPGCFSTNCAPDWSAGTKPQTEPGIDYLAKDYDSFRHTLISAMMQRVPGWQPTSEADLDQVLLELFSVGADELSDYQDRVMNEAYLATARKRVSLARHARLMDYHIHQGNQASTWLAMIIEVGKTLTLPQPNPIANEPAIPLTVWAGNPDLNAADATVFASRRQRSVVFDPLLEIQEFQPLLNQMGLYTWQGAIPALAAGSTEADLLLLREDAPGIYNPITDNASAVAVQNWLRAGKAPYLLLQERLNPATGGVAGRNLNKRQLLKLLSGNDAAQVLQDLHPHPHPLSGAWFVRVRWRPEDALRHNYCFTVDCKNGKTEHVSLFHANLIQVYHGRPQTIVFKEPGAALTSTNTRRELYYERLERNETGGAQTETWTIAKLPPEHALAYKDTPVGGEVPPKSTLAAEVFVTAERDVWDEEISLVSSDDSAENGDHFMVETDEERRSLLRFGNGFNGRQLPENAEVRCTYQVGRGLDGNVGLDQIVYVSAAAFPEIAHCWNPFDVTNGRDPEPVAEIIRRVPEAYLFRQLRAVTLADYVKRAEELSEVSKAAARYAWTGSWRTVQIAIDPVGRTDLDQELRQTIARYLDAVRLIGEDLEIRPPRFVPLEIQVSLCCQPDHWPEDLRFVLEQEFSDGYTPDGQMGFFHPDRWTFGQELYASQIQGRVQAIPGVEHVISVTMKRWNHPAPASDRIIRLRGNEILQVQNDPDHLELGLINFEIRGGRQ
jgi:hypothetical protein